MTFEEDKTNSGDHSILNRPNELSTSENTAGKAVRAQILAGGYTKGLSSRSIYTFFPPKRKEKKKIRREKIVKPFYT